jgi:threonyl-tRNA synthetase
MRLLFVHADRLEFEATTTASEDVAETEDVPMAGGMDDCVTAFVAVERADEADRTAVVENAAAEVRDVADQLHTGKVVLYPAAYLSDDAATPDTSATVLRDLGAELEGDFEVLRAPVGWYKAFEVSSKGHPLSEISRRVTWERGAGAVAAAATADRPPSSWTLAFPDGTTVELSDVDRTDTTGGAIAGLDAEDADPVSDDLRAVVERELGGETADEVRNGSSPDSDRPRHFELAREQGLFDHVDGRDASDRGDASDHRDADKSAGATNSGDSNARRWLPRGKLVRDSLAEYLTDQAVECGAMPVETADSSDSESSASQYSILRDLRLSESDLPMRIYESSTVPSIHTATRGLEEAKVELREQAELVLRMADDLGLNYVPTIRVTEQFYADDDEAWVESLVAALDRPALLELLPERRYDWTAKVDFTAIDRAGRPLVSSSVQLDEERAERLGIADRTDESNKTNEPDEAPEETRHPTLVHASVVSDIEDVVAALLDRAAEQDVPRLPTWLSPTQVRFVPIGESHVEYCDGLVADLEAAGIRADVDDRDATVGERIARAEADWVPYYAVVGDRELESDEATLKVTVRGGDEAREMDFETLQETVLGDVDDLPQTRRYLPKHVSKQPHFTGQ